MRHNRTQQYETKKCSPRSESTSIAKKHRKRRTATAQILKQREQDNVHRYSRWSKIDRALQKAESRDRRRKERKRLRQQLRAEAHAQKFAQTTHTGHSAQNRKNPFSDQTVQKHVSEPAIATVQVLYTFMLIKKKRTQWERYCARCDKRGKSVHHHKPVALEAGALLTFFLSEQLL